MPSLKDHQSNEFTIEDIVAHFNRPVLLNEHGCWLWQGATDNRGYGRYGPSIVYGIVWRMTGKVVPFGHELRHICVNRACINPDHICTGTHKENMEDAAKAGVMGKGARKYTDQDYETIYKLLALGWPQFEIAKMVGVSRSLIQKIINGELKHALTISTSE